MGEDESALDQVLKMASAKTFKRKSFTEKRGFLEALGKSGTKKALIFLKKLLEKRSFFDRKLIESRLGAVSGLEKMGLEEAADILRQGLKSRNNKIRETCRDALETYSRRERREAGAK